MNRRPVRKTAGCVGMLLCALLLCFNSGEQMSYVRGLSGMASGQELKEIEAELGGMFTLSGAGESAPAGADMSESLGEASGRVSVRLMGLPIKEIAYMDKRDVRVMPGGMSIGISIYTDGALVVGLGSVYGDRQVCPAAEAGIKAGDVITEVNGEAVEDTERLGEICGAGGDIRLTVRRDGVLGEYVLKPRYVEEAAAYRAGMWVRDSTSGIGTLSFCNMGTGRFGALGHPITDADTGSIIDVKSGSITESSIIGVSAGSNGVPGEVIGSFSQSGHKLGRVDRNCEYGIYGDILDMPVNPLYPEGALIAWPEDIRPGPAQVLCALDGGGVRAYECEIIKLYPQNRTGGKGMVIRITDRELISKTGGIVQGMSGSPVMQDGRMAGAVTHVFVNNSRCGYCIYACWMNGAAGR